MRFAIIVIAVLFAGVAHAADPAAPPPAAEPSNIKLSFTKPKDFIDATYQNRPNSRDEVMRDLSKVFTELGKRYLPPGQRLEIEVTDVDLAGRYEPWQIEHRETRFVRESTWPSISVKYRLIEGDREIKKGEEQIADMGYLTRSRQAASGDKLYYEKAMLNDWFRNRFASTPAGAQTKP